jgi:hypothetical protein
VWFILEYYITQILISTTSRFECISRLIKVTNFKTGVVQPSAQCSLVLPPILSLSLYMLLYPNRTDRERNTVTFLLRDKERFLPMIHQRQVLSSIPSDNHLSPLFGKILKRWNSMH